MARKTAEETALENEVEQSERENENLLFKDEADAEHYMRWMKGVLHKYHSNDEPARDVQD